MKKIKSLIYIIEQISKWSGILFAYLTIPIILIMAYGVFMRYYFHSPVSWTYEISLYLYFIQLVIAGAYGLLYGDHVKMDLFYHRLSQRKKAVIDSITSVGFFFSVGLVLWIGVKQGWSSYVSGERFPTANMFLIWPVKLFIPLSALLLLLQGLTKFIRDIHLAVKGKEI